MQKNFISKTEPLCQIINRERTSGEEEKDHAQLIDGVSENIFSHLSTDQRLRSTVRSSFQQFRRWLLCGQSQTGQSVHDQVDP